MEINVLILVIGFVIYTWMAILAGYYTGFERANKEVKQPLDIEKLQISAIEELHNIPESDKAKMIEDIKNRNKRMGLTPTQL
jgi:urea transporter